MTELAIGTGIGINTFIQHLSIAPLMEEDVFHFPDSARQSGVEGGRLIELAIGKEST